MKKLLRFNEIFILLPLFLLSFFLMFKTFQRSPDGNLKLASKVWSDFAATIPLIRSFSLGDNFPPQYPLFAGPPIRYHFLFYSFVGLLERVGLKLNWALNLPSALSLFLLLASIYFLGKKIFKSKAVGVLSLVFFIFNGSLAFLEFFKTHPLSIDVFRQIAGAHEFSSFGPYDGRAVSAFWSLNIFTNQRHLALSYAAFLLLVYLLYRAQVKKKISNKMVVFLTLLIGLFPFFHLAVFGMMIIALGAFFLLYPDVRRQIFLIGILSISFALPQILYMGRPQVETKFWDPGYLVADLNVLSFVKYWVLNLGLTSILAPIGLILAPKSSKKIFFVFLSLFIVGNLFRFSPEIAANHKFFNLFLIGANFFTAYALIYIWKRGIFGKILTVVSLFFLILSGIIDFFPIVNDRYIEIPDTQKNQTSRYILANTPKNSVFLNASYLYDPASLAGRKIYLGWPYFAWSAGYNTDTRNFKMKSMLNPIDKDSLCASLVREGIDYVEIQNPTHLENIVINYSFFEENFHKIFRDPDTKIAVFDVERSCI